MATAIVEALKQQFERHRLVFWYDAKRELRADFEALALDGVEKVEVANNQFGLKYRVLREAPKQKFLIYHEGPQPVDSENWLLDLQLAHGEFRTDQVAIWLSELELGPEFAELVEAHQEFFQAAKRREALKKVLKPDDVPSRVQLKMLAVCAGADPRLDSVLEHLFQELSEDRSEKARLIERCGLDTVLWAQLQHQFAYQSDTPGLRDFLLELFKSCYAMGTDGDIRLREEAQVLLHRWKDNRRFGQAFATLSNECAEALNIEQDLMQRDFRELVELDYFRLIDQKIVSDLVREIAGQTVKADDVIGWVRQRRQSHWYDDFAHIYQALEYAARFVQLMGELDLGMTSLAAGFERYTQTWFRLDQFYRKFVFHARAGGQSTLIGPLAEQMENFYGNNFLYQVNERWQGLVDKAERWEIEHVVPQRKFYRRWVQPFLDREHRVCVIISDALRYEIGEELLSRIRREDRYSAELAPMLGQLPSYTQLGMASLLPHDTLAIAPKKGAGVLIDGQSTQGSERRGKILQGALDEQGAALTAETLDGMHRDELREVVKANRVIYVYHNRIDHTGDKIQSEGQAFAAAEAAQEDILRLIKKLVNANVYNLLVTADHGFIYQDRKLDESDFSSVTASGDEIYHQDRRFVTGRGLKNSPGLRTFSAEALGLGEGPEVQIAKSINRLRLKGSGSRFVHGGAALQEVVVPVLSINKKRQSDTRQVDVEILRTGSNTITAGQLQVVFYQKEAVTDKVQPRVLRAGIYTGDGKLISDRHELIFDATSNNVHDREQRVRFLLTREADQANNEDVLLKLEERHGDTSHFREYATARYTLRRSFTSDFDF